ncbi:MAG: TerB family tellurite resistance protein [Bacteroidales bacterium]|nr:TerB family tellurite resistance protein [Bacteroidales bacterium]
MDFQELRETIKRYAGNKANSIILDESWGLKTTGYRYADISATRIEYTFERITFAADESTAAILSGMAQGKAEQEPYPAMEEAELLRTFASDHRQTMRRPDHFDPKRIHLNANDSTPLDAQPLFIIPQECRLCASPEGTGNEGTVAYARVHLVKEEKQLMMHNYEDIIYLKPSILRRHIPTNAVRQRTITRFASYDETFYSKAMKPYVKRLHDELGYTPDIEELYWQVIDCVAFAYHEVVSGERRYGAVVDLKGEPEVVFSLNNFADKVSDQIKDSVKLISKAIGNLASPSNRKNQADNRRTMRLLLAIAVADGEVSDDEKACLRNSLQSATALTSREKAELSELLNQGGGNNFLTDDDFNFNSPDNARSALDRMKLVASADGEHESETAIIKQLQNIYGFLEL